MTRSVRPNEQGDIYVGPIDDVWYYPGSRWAVFKRGERLGEHGTVGRGFRRLADAKAWAQETFGIDGWQREGMDYIPTASDVSSGSA